MGMQGTCCNDYNVRSVSNASKTIVTLLSPAAHSSAGFNQRDQLVDNTAVHLPVDLGVNHPHKLVFAGVNLDNSAERPGSTRCGGGEAHHDVVNSHIPPRLLPLPQQVKEGHELE